MRFIRALAFPHSLNFLNTINPDYDSTSVSDLAHPITYARGKGGVAIMWNRRLSHCISRIDTNDDRIVGVSLHGIHLTIFSVYLPSSNYASDFFQ